MILCIVNVKTMFPRVKMIQLTDWISDDSNQSNKNNAIPPVPAEVLMGTLFVLHYFSPTYLRLAYCNRLND